MLTAGPGHPGVLYSIYEPHGFGGSPFPVRPRRGSRGGPGRAVRRVASPHCSMRINICEHLQRDVTR